MSAAVLRPKLCEATWYKRMKCNRNFKTLNPRHIGNNKADVVDLGKKIDSKILGQKRVVQATPDREIKRRCLVKDSTETRKDEEMRKCGMILQKLMNHKHGYVFNEPVNVVALGFRDYRQIVKCPMDLGTVKLKLDLGSYENSLDFANDVRLTFHNARLYNRKGDDVHTMATVLLEMFDKLFDRNPPMRREMSEQERDQLGFVLKDFADKYIDEILQIVAN